MLDRALLGKIDALAALAGGITAALAELRAEVVAQLPPAESNGAGDGAADFAEHNLVSVQAASARWHVPQDTLRHWLRGEAGLGIRAGNVWRVSVPALRRRLDRRE